MERSKDSWSFVLARCQHLSEKLETLRSQDPNTRCYWFHVASAGEMEQIIPITRDLGSSRPTIFVLSYTSPSAKPFLSKLPHQENFLTLALPIFDRKKISFLLKAMNPGGVFFVRYDIWPALTFEALKLGLPLYLVGATRQNVRKGLLRWVSSKIKLLILQNFKMIFSVRAEDQDYFTRHLGSDRVTLAGEPKWARAKERADSLIDPNSPAGKLREYLSFERTQRQTPVVIFGSPHREEFATLQNLLNEPSYGCGHTIIIAPHEVSPSEISRIERALLKPGRQIFKLSESIQVTESQFQTEDVCVEDEPSRKGVSPFLITPQSRPIKQGQNCGSHSDHRIWIIDLMGCLAEIYGLADIAIVGGGFDGNLHNCLEPAAQGLPVLFGSQHERAPEALELIKNGAAMTFETPIEMFQFLRSCVSVLPDESVSEHPTVLLAQMALRSAELFRRVPNTSRVILDFLENTPSLESLNGWRGPFP